MSERERIEQSIAALRQQLAALEPVRAEDLTEMMNALWWRLDEAITEHGDLIDKHIGDNVLHLPKRMFSLPGSARSSGWPFGKGQYSDAG